MKSTMERKKSGERAPSGGDRRSTPPPPSGGVATQGSDVSVGTDHKPPTARDTSWVSYHSGLNVDYKRAISAYAVSHYLEFGQVIQLGSGTTLNALMSQITDYQRNMQKPLDLIILTTNLEIAQMGKEAAESDPKIFHSTQVIITGGILLPSLYSLVGDYAARNVRTPLIEPDIVFIGVAGIGFSPPNGRITYHFDQELKTQESYITRPARHRIILCDHSKLGNTSRWCSEATLRSLLANTDECTILSSYPSETDKSLGREREKQVVDEQIESFRRLMDRWRAGGLPEEVRADSGDKRTELRLLLVGIDGEAVDEVRLWED